MAAVCTTIECAAGAGQSGKRATAEQHRQVMERVRGYFSPEFLNRIDEVTLFNKLGGRDLDRIVGIQLDKLKARLMSERKIELVVEPEAVAWLSELSYDPMYGARPLRRVLQRHLLSPVATKILEGSLLDDSVVRVSLSMGNDGPLLIETLTTATEPSRLLTA